MLNIPWLQVKYIFNVIQTNIVHIKSIGKTQEISRL
jgi:hypothetical protein